MNALLIKCLEEHPTTIIPNFGAIMKLGNSFVYNEFLKFDDGKLIAFVATQKNISKEEAKIEVEKWSKEILNTLNIGNQYPIESVGIFTIENGKVVLKKIAELEASSTKTEKIAEEKKAEAPVAEIKPEPFIVEAPKPIENIKKEVKESDLETSSSLSAKMAIASIESFKDKNKLIEYTRGESRKTVIDALNTKLNQLNGKTLLNSEVKVESTKEVTKPEVILEVKKEDDSKEIEELIALTSTLDKVEEEAVTEKKEVKIKFEEPLKPLEKPIIAKPINKEEKTTEKEPSKLVEQVTNEHKPTVKKPASIKTVQEDKALEIIAEGVTKLEKEEKKRKKKRIFLFIGLICILSGGGILGYLNKDYLMSIINGESSEVAVKKEKKKEQKEEAKPTTEIKESEVSVEVNPEEIVEEPEVEVEETVEVTPVEVPVKDTKATPNSTNYSNSGNSSGDYLVIAGSFSVEANAKNLDEKLKSEGFSNAYIDFNSGTLIKVVAGTYTSKEEAKNAVDQLVSKDMKGFVQKK